MSRLDEDLGLSPKRTDGSELYKQNLRRLISYIKGNRVALMRELESDMQQAAARHEFERAADLRNKLHAMKELQRRVMFGDREFLDISKDRALADLKELFSLKEVPSRIEGFDISHMGGTNVVASMVVFTNGVSDRAEYRKFKTKIERNDDTGNMYETVYRRFSPKNIASWGVPGLILIDGGKGQLSAALKALKERQVTIPVIGIAKREEEIIIHATESGISTDFIMSLSKKPPAGTGVFTEGEYIVLNLHMGQQNAGSHSKNLRGSGGASRYTDVTKLFLRIRDESHRFAVSYHSVLKRKRQTASVLDEIPGIGPKTKKKLLTKFGSVRGIASADDKDLKETIGDAKVKIIRQYIN